MQLTLYTGLKQPEPTLTKKFTMRFYVLAGLIASRLAASHPGEDHTAELLVRREFLQSHLTNLDHCATDLEAFGLTERSIHRRRQTARFLRENRGLMDNRDKYALDTTYVSDTDSAHLFKSNVSCVLAPEEIVGPYCTLPCLILKRTGN